MLRLGYGDWTMVCPEGSPPAYDESNELWITIASKHYFVCSVDQALTSSEPEGPCLSNMGMKGAPPAGGEHFPLLSSHKRMSE